MTIDDGVDRCTNGGHRQHRPPDGNIGFVGLGRIGSAMAANVSMPWVSVARDRMITGLAHGYTEFDWSALGLVAAEAAGIEG